MYKELPNGTVLSPSSSRFGWRGTSKFSRDPLIENDNII
jgi:hypothetical protein